MLRWTTGLLVFFVALAPITAGAPRPPRTPTVAGVVGDGIPGSCTAAAFVTVLSSSDTVTFNCGEPETIPIASDFITNQGWVIDGGHVVTLSLSGSTPLFELGTGASLTLRNLVLQGATGVAVDGGVIVNHGRLTVEDSTFLNSQVTSGHSGGAMFSAGALTVTHSTFHTNSAGNGGAIFINTPQGQALISDSTFSQNRAVDTTLGYGGALWVGPQAQLTLVGGLIQGNSARFGGGLYVSPLGMVTARGDDESPVQLTANLGTNGGGGIYNDEGTLDLASGYLDSNRTLTTTSSFGGAIATFGTLTLTSSVLSSNKSRSGGGVFAGAQPNPFNVSIAETLIQANRADNGGGLFTNAASVIMTVSETDFYNNVATNLGGGLLRANAHLSIARSSFWDNFAQDGGGLYLTASPITNTGVGGYVSLRDSTISTNTATGLGGGLYNNDWLDLFSVTLKDNTTGLYNDTGGDARLRSTVLQNLPVNCAGLVAPTDHGFNFASDTSCEFPTSRQGNALNPRLGLLTPDPNGVTWYHLPLAGSPLINMGPTDCSPLDQRWALRPDTCDIGAVEFGGLLPELWLPLVRR